MKILHILKTAPDAGTKKIIETHSKEHQVKIVDLAKGGVSYDKLVEDIFTHDKVFSW